MANGAGAQSTLGERLRELRIADPYLKLREAAAALHSDPKWLSDIEAGRLKPGGGALGDLAKLYGADLRELIPLWEQWRQAPTTDLSRSICAGRSIHGERATDQGPIPCPFCGAIECMGWECSTPTNADPTDAPEQADHRQSRA